MARGDAGALEALFTRVGHLAYGLALEIVRDADAAEAIVIEAFAEIWRRAGESGPPWDPRGQLLHGVHRRAAALIRSSGTPAARDQVAPPPAPRWISLEVQAARELLATLPDEDREALELAYYSCYTQDELGARLDISTDEVAGRIANGLKLLGDLQRVDGIPVEGATLVAGRPARPPG